MPKGPREWSPREGRAEAFEDAVRQAFVDVYGPPGVPEYVERAILSSYLPRGEKLKWTEPSPDVVLVLTEFAWVEEPYSSAQDYQNWDRVVHLLNERGWKAGWDSINAAVQVVFLTP